MHDAELLAAMGPEFVGGARITVLVSRVADTSKGAEERQEGSREAEVTCK